MIHFDNTVHTYQTVSVIADFVENQMILIKHSIRVRYVIGYHVYHVAGVISICHTSLHDFYTQTQYW